MNAGNKNLAFEIFQSKMAKSHRGFKIAGRICLIAASITMVLAIYKVCHLS